MNLSNLIFDYKANATAPNVNVFVRKGAGVVIWTFLIFDFIYFCDSWELETCPRDIFQKSCIRMLFFVCFYKVNCNTLAYS